MHLPVLQLDRFFFYIKAFIDWKKSKRKEGKRFNRYYYYIMCPK